MLGRAPAPVAPERLRSALLLGSALESVIVLLQFCRLDPLGTLKFLGR